MVIRRLNISNFGELQDTDIRPEPGINVLCAGNERQKADLYSFIKGMLFGLTLPQEGPGGIPGGQKEEDPGGMSDRQEPEKQGQSHGEGKLEESFYGGTMWFGNQKKEFRVSRRFGREISTEELFCENTGELVQADAYAMGRVLGNVSETVYDNTVLVKAMEGRSSQELVHEVLDYGDMCWRSGDGGADLGRAMQMLKMSRKGFQVQKEKKQREAEKVQKRISSQMEELRRDMDKLAWKKEEVSDQESVLQNQESKNGALDSRILAARKKKKLLSTGMATAAALVLILLGGGRTLFPDHPLWWILPAVAGILLVGLGFVYQGRLQQEINRWRKAKSRQALRKERLKGDRAGLKVSFEEKETAFLNLEADYKDYEKQIQLPVSEDMEIQALDTAMEAIERVSSRFSQQKGKALYEQASRILRSITGGRFQALFMDGQLHMVVQDKTETDIPAERLSMRELRQIYFALHVAASDILCSSQAFPVILDNAFSGWEETDLAMAFQWLERSGRQVLVSSQVWEPASMQAFLEKNGIRYKMLTI